MRNKPIIPLTISLIIGILMYNFMEISLIIIVFCLIYLLLSKLFKLTYKEIFPLLICAIIGVLISSKSDNFYLYNLDYKDIYLEGIIEDKTLNNSGNYNYIVYKTKINNQKYNKRILLRNYSKTDNINIGDCIKGDFNFNIPKSNGNPNMFNYKNYLASKKIYGYIDLKKNQEIKINPTNLKNLKLKRKFKDDINDLFDNNLQDKDARLLKTIFLNDNYLTKDEINLHKNFGISHILSISGLHAGLIYSLIIFVLGNFNIGRRYSTVIALFFIYLYAYILGFPPSILRVLFMLTITTIAIILKKPWDNLNTLFLSMFFMLLINPLQIYSIGFQFTYLATFVIILFNKKIDIFVKNKILKIIILNIIIYLFMLPLTAFYFNEITLNFIIGALFILPIYIIVVVLGFLSIIFYMMRFILFYRPIFLILNILLGLLDYIFLGLNKLTFLKWTVRSGNIFEISLYYLILYLLIFEYRNLRKVKYRKKLEFLKVLDLSNLFVFIIICVANPVFINFIDIGQGDATLIRSLNNNILIDTGGEYFREKDDTLIQYFKKLGISKIDDIFITHFDYDHSGNLLYLNDVYSFKLYGKLKDYEWFSKEYKFNISKERFKDISKYKEIRYRDFYMDVFNNNINSENRNNNSVVYKLDINKVKILLTGDIEKEYENKLINNDYNIKSNILSVPHHGSKTSSTMEFIEKVNPKYAIISVGRKNIYGHPDKDVLDRYKNSNIKLYRTDKDGNITILVDKFGYIVKPCIRKYNIMDLFDIRIFLLMVMVYLGYTYLYNVSLRRDVFELQRSNKIY